jgi:hypothetical protein
LQAITCPGGSQILSFNVMIESYSSLDGAEGK